MSTAKQIVVTSSTTPMEPPEIDVKTRLKAEADIERIRGYRRSIRVFIRDMWGLEAQPVKPEYALQWQRVCNATGREWEQLKKEVSGEWFGDPADPNHPGGEWNWHSFIKGKHFTWQQNLILMGIEKAVAGDAKRLLSVVSGHGIGKSATCSWIILWFLYCYMGAQVPVTAPTSHQMHDVLWKELSIWINKMPPDEQALYQWTAEYVRMVYDPNSWFARARTSTKENTEAIAGVHSDHVCIVVDEGSGVPQQVYDTAEGALTSGNVLVIIISNGTQATGYFFNTQHRYKADWQNFGFNGEESPIVDRKYIALKAKHGVDSEEYKIRVKGGFPGEDMLDDTGYLQLVPENKITVRLKGGIEIPWVGRKILGVDPAGEGKDEATFCLRDRFKAEIILRLPKADDKIIAEYILSFIDKYKLDPADVVVGAFGTGADVGKEVAIASAKMKGGPYEIYTVLEGNSPEKEEDYNWKFFRRLLEEVQNPEDDPTKLEDMYLNIRALMYFRARKWLYGGGALVDVNTEDSEFANEFLQIRYKRSLQGNKIQLQSKREMNKLGIKSPNKSDACALTMLRTIDPKAEYAQKRDDDDEEEKTGFESDDAFNAL